MNVEGDFAAEDRSDPNDRNGGKAGVGDRLWSQSMVPRLLRETRRKRLPPAYDKRHKSCATRGGKMEFEKPDLATLESERDVEHKFLFPLLVADIPSGLGFDPAQVKAQRNLRKFSIGKGSVPIPTKPPGYNGIMPPGIPE